MNSIFPIRFHLALLEQVLLLLKRNNRPNQPFNIICVHNIDPDLLSHRFELTLALLVTIQRVIWLKMKGVKPKLEFQAATADRAIPAENIENHVDVLCHC